LLPDPDSPLIANHSLIGTGMTPTSGGNNVSIDNPQLGPLADNGGPTLTHALLPGSPALDAGDPDAEAGMNDVSEYDQRGAPFVRVFDGDGAGGARIMNSLPTMQFTRYSATTTATASPTRPITPCGAMRSAKQASRRTAAPTATATAK
jgi:hypothetical protein